MAKHPKWITPINEKNTPVNEKKTPINEKKTPINEKITPINEKKTPVNEKTTPVKTAISEKKTVISLEKEVISFKKTETVKKSAAIPIKKRDSEKKAAFPIKKMPTKVKNEITNKISKLEMEKWMPLNDRIKCQEPHNPWECDRGCFFYVFKGFFNYVFLYLK